MGNHNGDSVFCDLCPMHTPSFSRYQIGFHLVSNHRQRVLVGFKCDTCSKCYHDRGHLAIHSIRDHGLIGSPKMFHLTCDECAYSLKSFYGGAVGAMARHWRAKHCRRHLPTEREKLACDTCAWTAGSADRRVLQRHCLARHSGRAADSLFRCDRCPYAHNSRQKLDRHIGHHHLWKRTSASAVCDDCGHAFRSLDRGFINRHNSHHHRKAAKGESATEAYLCDQCGKSIKEKRFMHLHVGGNTVYRLVADPSVPRIRLSTTAVADSMTARHCDLSKIPLKSLGSFLVAAYTSLPSVPDLSPATVSYLQQEFRLLSHRYDFPRPCYRSPLRPPHLSVGQVRLFFAAVGALLGLSALLFCFEAVMMTYCRFAVVRRL